MGVYPSLCMFVCVVFTLIQLSYKSVSVSPLAKTSRGGNKPYGPVSDCYNMLIDA